jgi:hypothetical protein
MRAMSNSETEEENEGRLVLRRKPLARIPRAVRIGPKIYFVLCQMTGRVKCGIAANPRARLADLQVGSPTVLQLIGEMSGDVSKEKAIHRKMARWRVHGEWFHYVPDVYDIIVEELTSHVEDRYHGLYVARTKLKGHLPQPFNPP